jgi:hypothetical protein
MTIHLPTDPALFREAFNAACDRILSSTRDSTFYALFVELIATLRENALFKDYIFEMETISQQQAQEYSLAELEALEDSWMRLWRYHCHSLTHRKQLALIKRIVTGPSEISFSLLYNRILLKLWQFRYHSPLCRGINVFSKLFRSAQFELYCASSQFNHLYPLGKEYFTKIKVVVYKLNTKDKQQCLYKKIFDPGVSNIPLLDCFVECLPLALFSPKVDELEKRCFILYCHQLFWTLIWGNMSPANPKEILWQYQELLKLKPRTQKDQSTSGGRQPERWKLCLGICEGIHSTLLVGR